MPAVQRQRISGHSPYEPVFGFSRAVVAGDRVLVAGTAPVDPVVVARQADATIYCPDYTFLDATQVRMLRAANVRVLPWTVNQPEDWTRLLKWGVDGITTDYPDRLAKFVETHS